ncbi:peptidase M16 [Flavobacterium branchiophilum]|uniref:Insulinase family protein n=3 Tax=Flavobacterium branchiophilum TaxID=55197 RepID=A0A2H3KK89_9FLAO|nr:pitrilysin family protein [Flavobacterium branchiophilum]OXA69323.1 peptidase M16 [Flavobacterium branchiophilum] [Flavobacterium branchiophilum NBRC 15030 = ATCC 35035]PDS25484.1 insulinase family protein [Flavobacterium branchiophilum]GEM55576.1 peptidase M16 [Flavobacterium branchiophilum NBRC 15030 = ATCC 35035]CCB68748.1 Probable M16 family metallopeptidase precursor [Flavobacterium branchiophilum FL-15]
MKNTLMALSATLMLGSVATAQKVAFEEYNLDNGLHVILHNDPSAPTVITSVMYHVGAKDEQPDRTGFAHFFEHLLFEGTENIKRGEWFKIVTANGGVNNANTTEDRTYYYEVFPSNNLELGLWMESERMLHPVINKIGVDTQNEVVKEEKRLRYDNSPYGQLIPQVKKNVFKNHPYRWTTIGAMEHLDAATLEEFQAFNKKFYIPNNAVLIVAGDFKSEQAKEWIQKYFSKIPKGTPIERKTYIEEPITQTIKASFEDANIQIPMIVAAYRTPSMKTRDARVLDMISTILSDGKSSRLYKKIVDNNKTALQIGAFNYSQEDYGTYILYGLPQAPKTSEDILKEVDEEIVKLQTELISEKDLQKLQNKYENDYVNANASIEGIADNLATYYMLFKDVNLINTELSIYKSITREEIREVAKKYLNNNQRLILDYLPTKDKAKN